MTVAYKAENDDYLLEIIYMEDSENPRKEWDHACTMRDWHRRYDFMDGKTNPDEIQELFDSGEYWLAPVYMIDHSGVSISLGSFSYCDPGEWDSGVVGYIWIAKQDVKDEAQAITWFESEVKELDMYLRGEVFGFVLSQKQKCDHGDTHEDILESCWGFYWDSVKEIKVDLKSQLNEQFYDLIDELDYV